MALENIRIVLINPTHPGNIGAAARAMKTMRLDQLCLVGPKVFPHADATARAAGADDILANAKLCTSLDEAITDCHLVFGASARSRSLSCPVLDPSECADRALQEGSGQRIAMLFGREHSGLTNAELDRCHYLVHIPCNEEFSSLNLAAAVQVVCYELLKTAKHHAAELENGEKRHHKEDRSPVSMADMERFYQHLEKTLITTDFLDPEVPRHVMRRLRQLFNRARPDTIEMNVLRGFLTSVHDSIKKRR